jgi:hypothetical protein
MPKASLPVGHVHALDRVRVARGAVLHMTCPVLYHLPVCSHVCLRPVIVWPACVPHCVARKPAGRQRPHARLALALAPPPERPARPRLGAGCVPYVCADFPEPAVRARAFPACPTACRPSRLSLLSGAARSVSPRRLIDFRSGSHVPRLVAGTPPKPAIQPAPALPSVAAFPLCTPAKPGVSGCSTGAAVQTIALRFH